MNYRILCLLLSVSLMLSLICGCGKNTAEDSLSDSLSDVFSDTVTIDNTTDKTTLDLSEQTGELCPDDSETSVNETTDVSDVSVINTESENTPQSSTQPVPDTTSAQQSSNTSAVSSDAQTTAIPAATTSHSASFGTTAPTTPVTTVPVTSASVVTTAAAPVTTTPQTESEPLVLPTSHHLQFDAAKSGIYNYCPSVMQTDENTAYIYYCTNKTSKNVTDYIGCRKGTKNAQGKWSWSAESIVLSPGTKTLFTSKWDSRHACDPSVVAGSFKYNGEQYSYLMAYLGCTSNDSQDNKIGLAVARSPEGPFTKVGDAPFIDFEYDGSKDIWEWGVGQPSIINIDKKGRIMMFYTRGDRNGTRTIVEEWDLSDLSAPQRKSRSKLSTKGLKNLNGGGDIINNADFVYDPVNRRYYAVSDCHPNPSGEPDYISSHFRVNYFDYSGSFTSFTWKEIATVGNTQTGFARNHNTGILRDSYGHLPDKYLSVFYTVSVTGSDCLWSYRIYDYFVAVPK